MVQGLTEQWNGILPSRWGGSLLARLLWAGTESWFWVLKLGLTVYFSHLLKMHLRCFLASLIADDRTGGEVL